MPIRNAHQKLTMKSDTATIILVNAGRSAPNSWKICWNCGTTNTSRIALTMIATAMVIVG